MTLNDLIKPGAESLVWLALGDGVINGVLEVLKQSITLGTGDDEGAVMAMMQKVGIFIGRQADLLAVEFKRLVKRANVTRMRKRTGTS